MNRKLKAKIRESLVSVLPVTAIVLIISIFLIPMEIGTITLFMAGAVFLILGMGLFSLGTDISMTPLGEGFGGAFSKTKKIILIIAVGFFMGFFITMAEPDLQVLAEQVPSVPNMVLILAVAAGVGVCMVFAILRILFQINLSKVLLVLYIGVFILSIFVPNEFSAVSFDAGGVTTGPITVPFIMALGVGIAAMRSDKGASGDSFGLVALCSIGPIISVMLLGIFYNPQEAAYTMAQVTPVSTTQDVAKLFAESLPDYAGEVLIAFIPIICIFLLFELLTKKYTKRQFVRMLIGFAYTYFGLVLFLTGVNVGFMPVGQLLGAEMAGHSYNWILIPIGMIIGDYIVKAELAVHVLVTQVEEVTDGAISKKAMNLCLSIGVAVSVGLSMIRVLTGLSIYWLLIPGYAIALGLTFFVPKIFVGIAFDSGGVASGPMTSTFLLPLAMGACTALGGNIMTDAFGVVAMVAMTPLIVIQLMGLIYQQKQKRAMRLQMQESTNASDEIIDYEEEENE